LLPFQSFLFTAALRRAIFIEWYGVEGRGTKEDFGVAISALRDMEKGLTLEACHVLPSLDWHGK